MMITLLHKNNAKFERCIFRLQIILTKKLAISFNINKPTDIKDVLNGLTKNTGNVKEEK